MWKTTRAWGMHQRLILPVRKQRTCRLLSGDKDKAAGMMCFSRLCVSRKLTTETGLRSGSALRIHAEQVTFVCHFHSIPGKCGINYLMCFGLWDRGPGIERWAKTQENLAFTSRPSTQINVLLMEGAFNTTPSSNGHNLRGKKKNNQPSWAVSHKNDRFDLNVFWGFLPESKGKVKPVLYINNEVPHFLDKR